MLHQSWRDIVTRLIKTELCVVGLWVTPSSLHWVTAETFFEDGEKKYQSQQPGVGGEENKDKLTKEDGCKYLTDVFFSK